MPSEISNQKLPPLSPFSLRRMLITIAGALVLVLFVVHQFRTSPEWRHLNWTDLWNSTRAAHWPLLIAAVGIMYGTYLLRALRWSVLMVPRGRFWDVLKGTVIGFSAVALLGRPGEVVRPYYIARRHGDNYATQGAVWLLERTLDMASMVLLIALDLLLSPSVTQMARSGSSYYQLRDGAFAITAFMLAVITLLVLFHNYSEPVTRFIHNRLESYSPRIAKKIEHFLLRLAEGTQGLSRRRNLFLVSLFTVGMWLSLAGAVQMVVHSYSGLLPHFAFSEAVLLLGLALAGSIIQLPAVGGGTQVLIFVGLTDVFNSTHPNAAASASILIWLLDFYAVLPWGAVLGMHEGIKLRSLRHGCPALSVAAPVQSEASLPRPRGDAWEGRRG